MSAYDGLHPAIGALDVCPIVWLDPADRDAAARGRARGRRADRRARRPGLPLRRAGRGPERRERAYFRNGGLAELWLRMESGELRARPRPRRAAPDAPAPPWSPPARRSPPSTSSSTAATSRSPAPSPPACARRGAACPACGRSASPSAAAAARSRPTSTTRSATPLALVVERVRALAAPLGARPVEAELVGLIPEAALAGYPQDVPIRGFDPGRHTIERRLEGLERQPPPATD